MTISLDDGVKPIDLRNLIWCALALVVMVLVIVWRNLWALNFLHVICGVLWNRDRGGLVVIAWQASAIDGTSLTVAPTHFTSSDPMIGERKRDQSIPAGGAPADSRPWPRTAA